MKKIAALLLFVGLLMSVQHTFAQWVQFSSLDGNGNDAEFGKSVAISNDGQVVAVGDWYADAGPYSNSGQVFIFQRVGNSWVQLGNNITGLSNQELSGCSISLNADGSRVAIGAYGYDSPGTDQGIARVYYLNGNSWDPYGSPITLRGESSGDNAGWSVSLSGDGDRLAVGARLNDGNGGNSGHVRVFEYSTGSWVQVGSDIDGEAGNDRFGYAVSMNHDGTIFAAGGRFNDGNGSAAGHVRVFQESGGNWSQLGADLDGEAASDNFGSAVSLDSVGNTLAVGARRNDGNGSDAGHVRVFEYSTGSWSQVGSDIDGAGAQVEFGTTVGISPDGNIVAAGEPLNPAGPGTGQARAYYFNGSDWSQLGSNLMNLSGGWYVGNAIAVSNDSTVVIGASGTVGGGKALVFQYVPCQPTTGTDVVTACDSYEWIDGNTYTSSNNSATHTLTNAAGCDSIVTLDLTINYATTGTDVVSACGSYLWIDGNTYTSSNNSATYTLTGANGCDSVVTLNLTINTATTGTDVVEACETYTWIDGNTYTNDNTIATYTLTNAAGCGSVVTLNLDIHNNQATTDVVDACDSYTWIDGNTYNSSNNSASVTLTSAQGCDSVVTLDLTILNATTGTDVVSACNSYTWIDGNTYNSNNNSATYTLTNAAGCDSVVTLDLTISNTVNTTDVVTACDSYQWIDGNTYTSSNNSATYTLTSAQGCDSVVTLDLTINTATSGTDVVSACDSYLWIDGNTYTSSNNTATQTLTNAAGCDSVVTLDLTINNSEATTDVVSACGSYTWIDGITYANSTDQPFVTLSTAQGCDSVVTLDLTINTATSGTDVVNACNSYTWIDGNTYTTDNNTATHTLTNAAGCDSVVTLDLTISSTLTATDVVTACDSYQWIDGNTYTANNNSATHTLTSTQGCDSIVTLDLTINAATAGTDVVTTCDSYQWMDGNTYTSSNNSATYTLTNAAGCDSIVTLDLTINNSVATTDVVDACDSYTWIDGNTYTANNNSATHTLTSAHGCDSIVTLDLTINTASNDFSVVSACGSYTWNDGDGNTYTSSTSNATYTIPGGAANGCDSVMYLDVTITPIPSPTITQSGTTLEAPTGFDSYQWYDDSGAISGATAVSYDPTSGGNYYCMVEDNGCTGESNTIMYIPTGIASLSAENIQLYPNPTNDVVHIRTQAGIDQLVLMDLRGKVLHTQFNADRVDLSNVEVGIYLLRVTTVEGSIIKRVAKH